MDRIMVATDGSAGADRAVDMAAQLARGLAAELVILTVAGELSAEEMRQLNHAEADIGSALDSAAEQIVAAAVERASGAGVVTIHHCFLWGDPAEAILTEAARRAVDIIVLGRRGRGRLTGLLLGSVSQKLASLAPCPVLVVP
ncbi:universal stress protein [Sphingobium lignivorans]|uniref:Nucleotide-binding universal stress UspA family protein n=1 Tax=Sphingobium lignivorans TaxID=2735886 RepID=A0ABR6NBN7_9SPHN|nr:universal stress protein [Sphingobium lignivorans]MBB5984695.1 nucleotide-binding universal stress UspA family protein [Sphingobium lignivorans]